MKNSLLSIYTLIIKLTLKNYSPLRIFQILEIQKLEINSDFLDLGSTQSETNVSNYVKNKGLRTYANLNTNLKDQNNINLEIYPNDIKKKFKLFSL